MKNLFGEIKNITFEEHPGIEKGGCVIETNFGTIDAKVDQLESQIDKILKLAPTVPVVNSGSEPLSEESSETDTKASDEPASSETPTSEKPTKDTPEKEE